jgi:hypothetical protein
MFKMKYLKEWVVKQLNVHLTFFNDNLIQEIYMNQQLEGFEVKGVQENVYFLRITLYGFK